MTIHFKSTISSIEKQILKHKKLATITSLSIIIATLSIMAFLFYNFSKNQTHIEKEVNITIKFLDTIEYNVNTPELTNNLTDKLESPIIKYIYHQNSYLYIGISLYLLIFGVLLSLYRFHLNNIEKLEDKKLAFERILIAATLSKENESFSEVKESLANNAFSFSKEPKGIDSPIPGHYSSDLSVKLLNKIIDKINISIKK